MAIKLTVNTNDAVTLNVAGAESVGLSAEPYIVVDRTIVYDGSYEWTPTDEIQTIEIAGKKAIDHIKINPVPQNYGLITWNGSTLTVS